MSRPGSTAASEEPASGVDEGDLERWIDAFRGPLVGLVASWCGDWREAQEIAQDVFAEAWIGRARFEGDPGDVEAVGPWLRGIAFRLNAARWRARQRGPRRQAEGPADIAEIPAPTVDEVQAERLDAMRRGFEALSAEHQTVLRMHYLERSTAREVAALLDLSTKAVEQRLARARRALHEAATAVERRSTRRAGR